MSDVSYLNALRQFEVEQLLPLLPRTARILEFGAGTGQQARVIADHGFRVLGIDLVHSNYAGDRMFPIQDYDGSHVPIEDGSIDVIFSSNVLEHVENLDTIFQEFHRILRPNGICLHVLPTPSWRLWSFATAATASIRSAARLPLTVVRFLVGSVSWPALKANVREAASGFVPRGHGTSVEGVSELWTFSRAAWRRKFQKHGFDITEDRPMGIFYTGTLLLGSKLPIPTRRQLSRLLGSATRYYKVRPSSSTFL